jgi:DNA mismatch endonuclease (patch repair protein)
MDNISPATRSRVMAQIRDRENRSTELALIRIFRKHHITCWRRKVPLDGKPDFVFRKYRVVVFVDGCFWHGCPQHCRMPNIRADYWESKIKANVRRDKKINYILKRAGWIGMRFW